MSQFWSLRTRDLSPYTPGEQPRDTQYIKLNTNENPYPPSETVQQAIKAAVDSKMRLYPDPNADELKRAIAGYYDVSSKEIFVGNGSDEVLAHAFFALLKHDKPLLFPDISYSFYPVYCKLFEIDYRQIPLDNDFSIAPADYNLPDSGIIFPNPNAPTGKALGLEEIESFTCGHPASVIVVDEAYVDFGAQTAIPLTQRYNNILVVQTLSKSRSLAGLRVGFAIGSAELIEGLERVKNSFNSYPLARTAIAGGIAAIQDHQGFEENRKKIIATREWSTVALQNLGFRVIPSAANFVFAEPPPSINAEALYKALKARNILVRYFSLPRIDNHVRITIGTETEMQALVTALQEILKT